MSQQKENQFIDSVHRHLLPKTPYRMKNHNEYIGGIADVWYDGQRGDLWIEYKYMERLPNSETIRPKCTALQLEWLRARYDNGRNVAVILGTKEGGIIFTDLEWELAWSQDRLLMRVQSREEIAKWITEQTSQPYIKPAPRGKLKRIA